MSAKLQEERVWNALDAFRIELPSWGFANTGTRFGKFQQDAAATTTGEKLSDGGQVHQFTGCCSTVQEWRRSKGLAENPLRAFRESGYLARAARERAERNHAGVASYA